MTLCEIRLPCGYVKRWTLCAIASFLLANHIGAAEIATNGSGGGPWSDPATWRGKAIPTAKDDVVIQKHDIVIFDKNDEGKMSCRKLLIDPKGGLTFKTGAGKLVCVIGEMIESYGVIRLDGTKSATDFLELRLAGEAPEQRKFKMNKGSALLLYGRANLPENKRNVALTSLIPAEQKEGIAAQIEIASSAMIDWQRGMFHDIKLQAEKIDNTDAKPGERCNIVDNQFTGQSQVVCHTCDTPVIAKNTFENKGKPVDYAAISVLFSPLAEIKGNTIRGGYVLGIGINYQSDSVVIGNTIEKCGTGIQGGYGLPNTMIKQCTIRGCTTGFKLEGGSGVIEDVVVEGATTAYHQQNFTMQLTNFEVKDLDKKGLAVLHEGGTLGLLNCNIAPALIKLGPQGEIKPGAPPRVTALQYLVIAVKNAPPETVVDVRTINPPLPAGAADTNVRNTPAALVKGLTPLPRTLNPLIVKTWTMNPKGAVTAAPEYALKILGPATKEGADRPILKTMNYRPPENSFRAGVADATPTIEVPLK